MLFFFPLTTTTISLSFNSSIVVCRPVFMLGTLPKKDTAGVVQFLQYVRWVNTQLGDSGGITVPSLPTASQQQPLRYTQMLGVARPCCDQLADGRILLALLSQLAGGEIGDKVVRAQKHTNIPLTAAVSETLTNLRNTFVRVVAPRCGIVEARNVPTVEKIFSGNFEAHVFLLHCIFFGFVIAPRLGEGVGWSQRPPRQPRSLWLPQAVPSEPSANSTPSMYIPVASSKMLIWYESKRPNAAQPYRSRSPTTTGHHLLLSQPTMEKEIVELFADGSMFLRAIGSKVVPLTSADSNEAGAPPEENGVSSIDTSKSTSTEAPFGSLSRHHNWRTLFTVLSSMGLHNYFLGYLPRGKETSPSLEELLSTAELQMAVVAPNPTFLFMQAFYLFQVLEPMEDRADVAFIEESSQLQPPSATPVNGLTDDGISGDIVVVMSRTNSPPHVLEQEHSTNDDWAAPLTSASMASSSAVANPNKGTLGRGSRGVSTTSQASFSHQHNPTTPISVGPSFMDVAARRMMCGISASTQSPLVYDISNSQPSESLLLQPSDEGSHRSQLPSTGLNDTTGMLVVNVRASNRGVSQGSSDRSPSRSARISPAMNIVNGGDCGSDFCLASTSYRLQSERNDNQAAAVRVFDVSDVELNRRELGEGIINSVRDVSSRTAEITPVPLCTTALATFRPRTQDRCAGSTSVPLIIDSGHASSVTRSLLLEGAPSPLLYLPRDAVSETLTSFPRPLYSDNTDRPAMSPHLLDEFCCAPSRLTKPLSIPNFSHPSKATCLHRCNYIEVRSYIFASFPAGSEQPPGSKYLAWGVGPRTSSTQHTAISSLSTSALAPLSDGVSVLAAAPRHLFDKCERAGPNRHGSSQEAGSTHIDSSLVTSRLEEYHFPLARTGMADLVALNPHLESNQHGRNQTSEPAHNVSVRGTPAPGGPSLVLRIPVSLANRDAICGWRGGNVRLPPPLQRWMSDVSMRPSMTGCGPHGRQHVEDLFLTFIFSTVDAARWCYSALKRELQ